MSAPGRSARPAVRAAVHRSTGGPEVVEVIEVPEPEPGPGQVRVRVAAAALNPVDLFTLSGGFSGYGDAPFPRGFGWDAAGSVDAVGPLVTRWRVGDRVALVTRRYDSRSDGGVAQALLAEAGDLVEVPDGVSPEQAGALPLVGLTAAQALVAAGVLADDLTAAPPAGASASVLVLGADGAVGQVAVQLAAAAGARVIAVTRTGTGSAGDGRGIVVAAGDLPAAVTRLVPAGVDAAVNAASATLDAAALAAVRDGGRFATVVGAPPPAVRGTTSAAVSVVGDTAQLTALLRLAARGRLHVRIALTVPLDRTGDGLRAVAAGGLGGKVLVLPGAGRTPATLPAATP